MKKMMLCFLTLALIMSATFAVAEGPVIIEGPDNKKNDATGRLDDIRAGMDIDLDDRIYMPTETGIYNYFNGVSSHSDHQYVALFMTVLNLATKEIDCFKSAQVVVVYEGERGTYKFAGSIRQWGGGSGYYNNQQDFRPIGVLLKRSYVFFGAVPNFVEENPGEIRMEITDGNEIMTCIIRK